MDQLLYKAEVYAIVGAAMEVHRVLGPGFLEGVYQEALALEFRNRQIPFDPQHKLKIRYKNGVLESEYKSDFLCYEAVIVELKALDQLSGTETAQVINYLKASGFAVGLLLNFGKASLDWHRFVY